MSSKVEEAILVGQTVDADTVDVALPMMTLRQWYAGMILQGTLAADPKFESGTRREDVNAELAAMAVRIADELLKQEAKT